MTSDPVFAKHIESPDKKCVDPDERTPLPVEVIMQATSSTSRSRTQQSWGYERQLPGGIVVGVDGSSVSVVALKTAAALARSRQCALHVMSILAPFPSYRVNRGADVRADDIDQLRVSLKGAELRELLDATNPEESWTCQVEVGDTTEWLTSVAERRGAELLVVGRSSHDVLDRITGSETVLTLMRSSRVPVLAVDREIERPSSIVVATDFLESSTCAAKLALDLLGKSGTLFLVYVDLPLELFPNGFALPGGCRFPGDAVSRFRRLIGGLAAHPGVFIEQTVLSGSPIREILQFANRVGADVVAAGTHSHSRLDRLLLGSVATGLVRHAQSSVLIVPNRS